jgi:alpha/beta superfamily hydrolase
MELSEAPVSIPGSPALEGVWVGSGSAVAVVAPPHPLMGGELDNPVVRAIAAGFVRAGLRVLLFNYRGVGESFGDASGDPEHAVSDFCAALELAGRSGPVRLVAGYSFGGAAALVVAGREPARRAFAVAPPPSLVSPAVLSAASSVTIIAGNRDGIAPAQAFRDLTASSPGVVVETLLEADHFFSSDLGTITRFAERAAEADA